MRYNSDSWEAAQREMVRDADQITSGAANPVAVTGVLQDMLVTLRHHKQPLEHPAALVTLSHLSFLLAGENVAAEAWATFAALNS